MVGLGLRSRLRICDAEALICKPAPLAKSGVAVSTKTDGFWFGQKAAAFNTAHLFLLISARAEPFINLRALRRQKINNEGADQLNAIINMNAVAGLTGVGFNVAD